MRDIFWSVTQYTLGIGGLAAAWCGRRGIIDRELGFAIMVGCGVLLVGIIIYLKPRYRPYTFRKLRKEEISERTQQGWDRLTNDFELLGYRTVGDFELFRRPVRCDVRYLVSSDPTVLIALCTVEGKFHPELSTYFDDGRMIETGNHPDVTTRCRENENLWASIQPGANAFDLNNIHQAAIKTYRQETGAEPIAVTPDRIFELVHYSQRLMWWEWRGQTRHLGKPVPPRRLETTTAAPEEAVSQAI